MTTEKLSTAREHARFLWAEARAAEAFAECADARVAEAQAELDVAQDVKALPELAKAQAEVAWALAKGQAAAALVTRIAAQLFPDES